MLRRNKPRRLAIEKTFAINQKAVAPQLSNIEDKLLKDIEEGKVDFTEEEFKILGNLDNRVNINLPKGARERRQRLESMKDSDKLRIDKQDQDKVDNLRRKINLKKEEIKELEFILSSCRTCH